MVLGRNPLAVIPHLDSMFAFSLGNLDFDSAVVAVSHVLCRVHKKVEEDFVEVGSAATYQRHIGGDHQADAGSLEFEFLLGLDLYQYFVGVDQVLIAVIESDFGETERLVDFCAQS